MVIKARGEKDYIFKYLTALQGTLGFSPRELQIAVLMVYRYKILLNIKDSLKGEKARDAFNPMKELKKPEILESITEELDMSFPVFRNYISSLKNKGFFENGKISDRCVPLGTTTTITISNV